MRRSKALTKAWGEFISGCPEMNSPLDSKQVVRLVRRVMTKKWYHNIMADPPPKPFRVGLAAHDDSGITAFNGSVYVLLRFDQINTMADMVKWFADSTVHHDPASYWCRSTIVVVRHLIGKEQANQLRAIYSAHGVKAKTMGDAGRQVHRANYKVVQQRLNFSKLAAINETLGST